MTEDTQDPPAPVSVRGAAYWVKLGAVAVVTLATALAATTTYTLSEVRAGEEALERRHAVDIERVEDAAKEDRATVQSSVGKLGDKIDRLGEALVGRHWKRDDEGQ